MLRPCGLANRRHGSLLGASALLCALLPPAAHARDIGVAFIEDALNEPTPRISELIVQELQPLLNSGDKVVPVFLRTEPPAINAQHLLSQAYAASDVDIVIATGYIASQVIYQNPQLQKPTYLLSVLDPSLTGIAPRDRVNNLRSYISVNAIVDVFSRISELFGAERVGIALPANAKAAPQAMTNAVLEAARQAGVDAEFLLLDYSADLGPQLADLDTVLLPPISTTEQERTALLNALRAKKIPSFVVGGDSLVVAGALISDTVDEDRRVLARRVALDLQLAIAGESRTRGVRLLEPKRRTTINIDTARAIDVDFQLDELMNARIVQGSNNTLSLSFLSALEQAMGKNLDLRAQQYQLQIDTESLVQARAAKRPQIAAQVEYTRRGEALPAQDTLAVLAVSQTLYSASENAAVNVAKLGLKASESSLEQQQLDTVQRTASAYFQALQTQAQFESSLRDLALNRENLSLAEKRKSSGSGSGADIYRWQAIIANSESALLGAYTANTSAQHQLVQLLNSRMEIPTRLAEVDLDQPPFDLLHQGLEPFLSSTGRAESLRRASASRALLSSPQLASLESNIGAVDTNLTAIKRAYYTPSLSLSASYAHYLDSSENAAGIELDGEGDWNMSLKAELPLWLGGTRSSTTRQLSAQKQLADTQLRSLKNALWSNSGIAVDSLISNYRRIGLSDRAEDAARKSHEITQKAYKLGASSVTDLLDTQNSYREAQDNANNARYQYLNALVDFQALMGEMPMLTPGTEQQQWLLNFTQSMLDEHSK